MPRPIRAGRRTPKPLPGRPAARIIPGTSGGRRKMDECSGFWEHENDLVQGVVDGIKVWTLPEFVDNDPPMAPEVNLDSLGVA